MKWKSGQKAFRKLEERDKKDIQACNLRSNYRRMRLTMKQDLHQHLPSEVWRRTSMKLPLHPPPFEEWWQKSRGWM